MEERLFRGEGMTVNVTSQSVFSDLTFTMLEDTGWYIPGECVCVEFMYLKISNYYEESLEIRVKL